MKLQFHPASARRGVFSLELTAANQKRAIAILLVAVLLAGVLPLSAAYVFLHLRWQASEQEAVTLNARRREALEVALSGLKETDRRLSLDRGLLVRIAILYDAVAPARSAMDVPAVAPSPENRFALTEEELNSLTGLLGSLEAVEAAHPDWPALTPAALPLTDSSFVVAKGFGWTFSRLTQANEFEAGLTLAAAAGRPVFAAADGVVRWAGAVPLRPVTSYSHLVKVVAIRHGTRYVTLYGRLSSVEVRRGQRVRKGEEIGTVGMDPILAVPRLHYEVWKLTPGRPVPLDPRLAMLGWNSDLLSAIVKGYLSAPVMKNVPELPAEFQ